MGMKTLIVYELVPEATKFFLTEGYRSELHGCFINSQGPEQKGFSAEIRKEVGDGSDNEHWTEVKMPFICSEEIVVVHCGFIL